MTIRMPYPNPDVVRAMLARARQWQKEQEKQARAAKRLVSPRTRKPQVAK